MAPPKVRMSFEVWASFAVATISVVALHVSRPLDFSPKPLVGVVYWSSWAAVAGWWLRQLFALSRAQLARTGASFPTLLGNVTLRWEEVLKVQKLKRGGIALFTSSGRVVFPLGLVADQDRVQEYIVAAASEAGANVVDDEE